MHPIVIYLPPKYVIDISTRIYASISNPQTTTLKRTGGSRTHYDLSHCVLVLSLFLRSVRFGWLHYALQLLYSSTVRWRNLWLFNDTLTMMSGLVLLSGHARRLAESRHLTQHNHLRSCPENPVIPILYQRVGFEPTLARTDGFEPSERLLVRRFSRPMQ